MKRGTNATLSEENERNKVHMFDLSNSLLILMTFSRNLTFNVVYLLFNVSHVSIWVVF